MANPRYRNLVIGQDVFLQLFLEKLGLACPEIVIYGAGQHTEKILAQVSLIRNIKVIAVLDDFADIKTIMGIPVHHPNWTPPTHVDAVLVSSDSIESTLAAQASLWARKHSIPVIQPYAQTHVRPMSTMPTPRAPPTPFPAAPHPLFPEPDEAVFTDRCEQALNVFVLAHHKNRTQRILDLACSRQSPAVNIKATFDSELTGVCSDKAALGGLAPCYDSLFEASLRDFDFLGCLGNTKFDLLILRDSPYLFHHSLNFMLYLKKQHCLPTATIYVYAAVGLDKNFLNRVNASARVAYFPHDTPEFEDLYFRAKFVIDKRAAIPISPGSQSRLLLAQLNNEFSYVDINDIGKFKTNHAAPS